MMLTLSVPTAQISNNTLEIFSQVTPFAALHQGWYVTVPDLEGSKVRA